VGLSAMRDDLVVMSFLRLVGLGTATIAASVTSKSGEANRPTVPFN
jgi:hypothetical protein